MEYVILHLCALHILLSKISLNVLTIDSFTSGHNFDKDDQNFCSDMWNGKLDG